MLDLTSRMDAWSKRRRRWAVVLFVVVTMPLAVVTGLWMGHVYSQPDAGEYLDLAAGKAVMLPFAARQLGPLLVRGMAWLLHLSLETGYLFEGLAALLCFLSATAFLLVRSGAPRWILPALAGIFFWSLQFNALVMPDLVYAALLGGFLLLLRKEQMLAAALMMFPLTVSRESTLLTLVCFLLAGWRRLKWTEVAAAVVSTVAGMAVVKHLTANALANQEKLPPMLYMAAKMPWNFLKNVLGLGMWANVYPACETPRWQTALHLGPVRAIGYCGFYSSLPIETFGFGLVSFGLLPVLLLQLRKVRATRGGRGDMLLRFALIYGSISFVLAPLLGESMTRLYGYAWPLFLVALPLLLGIGGANFASNWSAAAFVGLHLFLSWAIFWMYPGRLLMVAVVCYAAGWWLCRRTFRVGGAGQKAAADQA